MYFKGYHFARSLGLFSFTFIAFHLFFAAQAQAQGSPFVLQCASDERITRVVTRTGARLDFIAIDCTDRAGRRRVLKAGGNGGERREFIIPSGIETVSTSRGRCGAPTRRVCSIAMQFGDGARTGTLGTLTNDRQQGLGDGAEIYGFWGRSGAEIDELNVLTRKSVAQADSNYDLQAVVDTVNASMDNAMGYALVIRRPDGQRVAFSRAGWAIHPLDSDFARFASPFTVRTQAAMGSTTKMWATAAAVMRLDEMTQADTLGTPFRRYLPNRWRDQVHTRFQQSTVQDVIRQTAGFRRDGNGTSLPDRLSSGDNPFDRCPLRSTPPYPFCYSNAGGGLFHYILPHMMLAADSGMAGEEARLRDLPRADYDRRIQDFTSRVYREFVQENVLRPAGVTATCNARDFLNGGRLALGYSSPRDRSGTLTPDQNRNCASGGWIISAEDLSRVIWNLRNTNQILTPQSRARFFATDNTSRVWSIVYRGQHIHDGGWLGFISGVVAMDDGYTAVIVSNSAASLTRGNLDRLLVDTMLANRR